MNDNQTIKANQLNLHTPVYTLVPFQAILPIPVPEINYKHGILKVRSLEESIVGGTFDNLHAGHKVKMWYMFYVMY